MKLVYLGPCHQANKTIRKKDKGWEGVNCVGVGMDAGFWRTLSIQRQGISYATPN